MRPEYEAQSQNGFGTVAFHPSAADREWFYLRTSANSLSTAT
jgi:hypothetical protein